MLTAASVFVCGVVLLLAWAVPAGAEHEEDPRRGLEEIGFHPLLNAGFNTDIWTHVTGDDRLFAYSGTWGTLIGNDPCPSETDNPSDPQKSGVKIVDATDPANPELVEVLGTVPGAQNLDIKVLTDVETEAFQGDLLAHSLEPCGANLGVALVDVLNDVPKEQTGFQLYDVTDPANPEQLGDFNNGGIGTHNLYVFDRPDLDQVFVAAVWRDINLVSGTDGAKLQFVDVSDPDAPSLVSEWELADAEAQGGPTFDELCKPRGEHFPGCNIHDIWISDDGETAYLSFWDAGLILLDITDVTEPTFIGQVQPGGTDNEGNTHAAVPYHIGDRHYVIVGDEDFVGPGQAPFTIIEEAPEDADVAAGEDYRGTEMSNTEPVAAGPVGPFPALPADSDVTCTFSQAGAFGASQEGWIGVVRRGNCPFQTMVTNAETAGADGLIIVNNEPEGTAAGTAAGEIPAMMIEMEPGDRLLSSISATSADVRVQLAMQWPDGPPNPWGYMRVVDVTDDDPANWRQVSTFKAPHVDVNTKQGPENVFSAHNPLVGPDGRVYFSWYTDGVRVLEPQGTDGTFEEVAWFVPLPSDHDDDLDQDPHNVQEDNSGFWGSQAVRHPTSGELLVFNSDLNRGMYILGMPDPEPEQTTPPAPDEEAAEQGALPATGAGAGLLGLALVGAGLAGLRRLRR